jgi:hypothetical protein
MSRKRWFLLSAAAFSFGFAVWLVCRNSGEDSVVMNLSGNAVQRVDLSAYADTPPAQPLQLLFIHHSCGAQLLASSGPESDPSKGTYPTSTNGGGLRARLEKLPYGVHEATYGSQIGEKTDIFDWLPKFRDQMDEVLACDVQDQRHADGKRNDIVLFKSCFPNNNFASAGISPGNPSGPELSLWNAKAAYEALLPEFRKHPNVLFVCLTAPPLVQSRQPLWKRTVKRILGRGDGGIQAARLARQFNNWLSSQEGWLKDYSGTNVVVFDYYDILTDHGVSDFSVFPASPWDSHPSREGNERAAEALVPFLNRAVHRAGMGG